METKKITLPEGWEVDKVENGEIYLKETAKRLPNTWEEYKAMYDNGGDGIIIRCKADKYADVFSALHKLILLRDVYRRGWVPDLSGSSTNYCISYVGYIVITESARSIHHILSFQSAEIRDLFLENFRELIETAKELI